MNKYKNIKIKQDDIEFSSKHEAEFYSYLLTLYPKEKIILQPRFILQDKFIDEWTNTKIRIVEYVADFQYENVIWDVKGFATETAKLKRKLFLYKYPNIQLIWVTKCPKKYGGGFIEVEELERLKKGK